MHTYCKQTSKQLVQYIGHGKWTCVGFSDICSENNVLWGCGEEASLSCKSPTACICVICLTLNSPAGTLSFGPSTALFTLLFTPAHSCRRADCHSSLAGVNGNDIERAKVPAVKLFPHSQWSSMASSKGAEA